jgi:hypothetical protein
MNESVTEQPGVASDRWKANESIEQETVQGEGRSCSETVRETGLHQHAKNEVGVRAGRFVDVAPLGCESCPSLQLLKLATGLEEAGGLHYLASVSVLVTLALYSRHIRWVQAR